MQQVLDEDSLPHVTAHVKTQSGEVTTTQTDYADPGGLGLKQQNARSIVTRLMKTLNGSCFIGCIYVSVCTYVFSHANVRICMLVVLLDLRARNGVMNAIPSTNAVQAVDV